MGIPAVCARGPMSGTDQSPVLSGVFVLLYGSARAIHAGPADFPAGTFAGTTAPMTCIKSPDTVLVQLAGPYPKVRCRPGELMRMLLDELLGRWGT